MKHTPRSRDLAKSVVSLGTGTATLAAFAATGALAGSIVPKAAAPTAASDTSTAVQTPTPDTLALGQQLADKLAQQVKTRRVELRKLNRLITRAKKTAQRVNVSASTTSSGTTSRSTTTTRTTTPTKTTSKTTTPTKTKAPAPAPAPSSGS
jgi:hypothetical protein